MELAELLSEKQVCVELAATDRDEAVHEILTHLVSAGRLQEDEVAAVLRAVVKRETLGTTAIGRGMAVPHARVEAAAKTMIGIGLSGAGVDFHALDGAPVHAIFIVIGSASEPDEYIEALKQVSNMIQNEDFRRFLKRARSAGEVVDLMEEMAG